MQRDDGLSKRGGSVGSGGAQVGTGQVGATVRQTTVDTTSIAKKSGCVLWRDGAVESARPCVSGIATHPHGRLVIAAECSDESPDAAPASQQSSSTVATGDTTTIQP